MANFIAQRLSKVLDTGAPLRLPPERAGPSLCRDRRLHVRFPFDAGKWIQRRRPSDCRVPLHARLRWRRDVLPMFPRLRRYAVCLQASAQLFAASPALLKAGFPYAVCCSVCFRTSTAYCSGCGRRCGRCDVNYYSLRGQCYECGDIRLVFFLSRALPANGILVVTTFFYWAGMFALPRGERIAVIRVCATTRILTDSKVVRVVRSCVEQPIARHGPVPGFGELLRAPCVEARLT